ncbi:MAG: ABC transporter substrate-binding protein, partial [Chloroflexota bacterium]
DSLRARLAAVLASGQAPDLAIVGGADPAMLAARGQLIDLRDSLDRIVGLNGELFPPLRALAENGPFVDRPANQPAPAWAIPHLSVGGGWLIRQDLLARQNLAPPKTFDDARTIALKLATASGDRFGWGSGIPIDEAGDGLARVALLAYGASIFDALGLRIALDPSAAAAGLQAVANLGRADDGSSLAPPGAVDWTPDQTAAALAAGRVAQTIDLGGVYSLTVTRSPSLLGSIVALPPPAGPKGWFTSAPSTFLIVPRQGRAPARAVAIVEQLLRPARYDQLVRTGQGSVIPPYAYLTKGPFWDEDANYAAFAANARGDPARSFQFAAPGFPSPPTLPAAVIQASDALSMALRRVVTGDSSAPDAASALVTRLDALARQSLSLQPTPTPTPVPFWLQLIRSASAP